MKVQDIIKYIREVKPQDAEFSSDVGIRVPVSKGSLYVHNFSVLYSTKDLKLSEKTKGSFNYLNFDAKYMIYDASKASGGGTPIETLDKAYGEFLSKYSNWAIKKVEVVGLSNKKLKAVK
jgi:hypothetical protein